jgi:thiamine-phosphate pyrophosphorylase
MKLIVITAPKMLVGEAEMIELLLKHGVDILHIRKPMTPEAEVVRLLESVHREWHNRIMLHDLDFGTRFALKGLHLNSRRPMAPIGFKGCLSAACHSFKEVVMKKSEVDYVFLSPIFDSISKSGYYSAYTKDELRYAQENGVIDNKVIALGGITLEKINDVASLGFGGVALLGDVWNRASDRKEFIAHIDALRDAADR